MDYYELDYYEPAKDLQERQEQRGRRERRRHKRAGTQSLGSISFEMYRVAAVGAFARGLGCVRLRPSWSGPAPATARATFERIAGERRDPVVSALPQRRRLVQRRQRRCHRTRERAERVPALEHAADRDLELLAHRRASSASSRRIPLRSPGTRRAGPPSARRSRPKRAAAVARTSAPAGPRRDPRASRTADRPPPDGTGRLTVNPRPSPDPASAAGPVPGYSGDWWIETNSTRSLVVEDVVRPVAVVHVPVDDHHALEPTRVERVLRRERDVVEQAEAHRARRQRVMSRRAMGAERVRRRAVEQQVDHPHRPAGGMQRRLERLRADDRVGVEMTAACSARPLDRRDVRLGVDRLEHRRGRSPAT